MKYIVSINKSRFSLTLLFCFIAVGAKANSVNVTGSNQGTCDAVTPFSHAMEELGTGFPVGETITVDNVAGVANTAGYCGLGSGSGFTDYTITITNTTTKDFHNVWFVADTFAIFGNVDGQLEQTGGAGSGDSMRIDAVGGNQPLISDDNNDGIFSAGETWIFKVLDWDDSKTGALTALSFGSQDIAKNSAANGSSHASIVANVVPVPATVWLFGSAIGLLGWMRRKKT